MRRRRNTSRNLPRIPSYHAISARKMFKIVQIIYISTYISPHFPSSPAETAPNAAQVPPPRSPHRRPVRPVYRQRIAGFQLSIFPQNKAAGSSSNYSATNAPRAQQPLHADKPHSAASLQQPAQPRKQASLQPTSFYSFFFTFLEKVKHISIYNQTLSINDEGGALRAACAGSLLRLG